MELQSATGGIRQVDLIVTPLQCYYTYGLSRIDYAAQHNEHHKVPFKRLQHWAVQVGKDQVYEITSLDSDDGSRDLQISSVKSWWDRRSGCPMQILPVGVTEKSNADLDSAAKGIWDLMFHDDYRAMSRNCQSFAELFRQVIHDETLLNEEDKARIFDMPSSFNPVYAIYHLKDARRAFSAVKNHVGRQWTFLSSSSAQEEASQEYNDGKLLHKTSLPFRRTTGWLHAVNDEAKGQDIHGKEDFRKLVHRVNTRRREELEASRNPDRWSWWSSRSSSKSKNS